MSLKARARAFWFGVGGGPRFAQGAAEQGGETAVDGGRLLALQNQTRELPRLRDYGFRVFSQLSEDGILQHLTHRLGLRDGTFVEIDVEDSSESNTRYLVKDDWRGLSFDANAGATEYLHRSGLGMRRGAALTQAG